MIDFQSLSTEEKRNELIEAIDDAVSYDNKIIAERAVENLMELNISILGNYENLTVGAIEQVLPSKDLLTYEDKYIGGGKKGTASKGMASASRKIPATINDKLRHLFYFRTPSFYSSIMGLFHV